MGCQRAHADHPSVEFAIEETDAGGDDRGNIEDAAETIALEFGKASDRCDQWEEERYGDLRFETIDKLYHANGLLARRIGGGRRLVEADLLDSFQRFGHDRSQVPGIWTLSVFISGNAEREPWFSMASQMIE